MNPLDLLNAPVGDMQLLRAVYAVGMEHEMLQEEKRKLSAKQ